MSEENPATVLCPRCKTRLYTPYDSEEPISADALYPAVSRVDNKTYICSDCGREEMLEGLHRFENGVWKGDSPAATP